MFRPWLVGGLAALLLAVVGVAGWALRSDNEDDEAETSGQKADSTSEPPEHDDRDRAAAHGGIRRRGADNQGPGRRTYRPAAHGL